MYGVNISGLEIQDNLEFIKDALTVHFRSIRQADSCFGSDHAELLKSHIDHITNAHREEDDASMEDIGSTEEPTILPLAISRFPPRAIFNPIDDIGMLRILPREIRDTIYGYALSPDCPAHTRACSCTKEERRASSAVSLLRTCSGIYSEVVSLLYRSEVFGISMGYVRPDYGDEEGPVEWIDPFFYRQTAFDQQVINHLPYNALHLIENLELNFTNDTMRWSNETEFPFVMCNDIFLSAVTQICTLLKDSDQIQYLDINLTFGCKFGDIDYMARLLEPIKMLRGIRDPNITVYGYQNGQIQDGWPPHEPRWGLTDEFTEYLQELLMSPHNTPTPSSHGLPVFRDCYQNSELNSTESEISIDELRDAQAASSLFWPSIGQNSRNYLRDVYVTEEVDALEGGMPERWQMLLNSEHGEECEWFNADDEEIN